MTQTGDSGATAHGAPNRRRRLGEVLVSQGVLTDAQLQDCLAAQKELDPGNPRRRLGVVVVDKGLADERQIATALASALDLPVVDLGRRVIDADIARMLPRAVAERLGVLILGKQGPIITVATADPTNVVALDDTRLYTGASQLEVVVATESQVREHLGRAWSLSEDSPDVAGLFDEVAGEAEDEPVVSAETAETAPIVRLADVVFSDAVRARVSESTSSPSTTACASATASTGCCATS